MDGDAMNRPLIALIVLLAGCAGPAMTPSASVTTTMQGWERYFSLEWTPQHAPDGSSRIEGYVHNTYGSPMGNVRVLAQALDPAGQVIGQRIEWVPGIVPNFGRSYFIVPALPPAPQYRVSVWAFDIIDYPDFPRRW
jgi:hypothetical protein